MLTGPTPVSLNFAINHLDLSHLIGKPVTVFSKQFPGKPIPSHVVSVSDNKLKLSSDGNENILANLVTSQQVVIQIPYRGEWLSINAQMKKTDGGKCEFIIDGPVVPLSQRKFIRLEEICSARMAVFSLQTLSQRPLHKLRWIETETLNFSSGGALVRTPGYLDDGLYMLINIEVKYKEFPAIVLAQVRYCFQDENSRQKTGIEFVVRELAQKKYSRTVLKHLPESVMTYTAPAREKINRIIQTDLNLKVRSYRS